MLIYRLETNSGQGIYSDYDLMDSLIIQQDNESHHLPPTLDPLLCDKWEALRGEFYKWFFGFNSPRLLLDWFDNKEGRQEVAKYDTAHIMVYDVANTHVRTGTKQTIFIKDKAILKSKLSLDYFDKNPLQIETGLI